MRIAHASGHLASVSYTGELPFTWEQRNDPALKEWNAATDAANARLIAAAPSMKELVRWLADAEDEHSRPRDGAAFVSDFAQNVQDVADMSARARALLREIEGEP